LVSSLRDNFGFSSYRQHTDVAVPRDIMAMIAVTLGGFGILDDFWEGVESWPSLMDSPLAALECGLRGFWGESWHQSYRNVRPLSKLDIGPLLMNADFDESRESTGA
jgi:hypothetical protein